MEMVMTKFYDYFNVPSHLRYMGLDNHVVRKLYDNINEYIKNGFEGKLKSVTEPKERDLIVELAEIYLQRHRFSRDELFSIGLQAEDLSIILNLCLQNRKYNDWLCNNQNFWRAKLKRDYDIKQNLSWMNNPKQVYKEFETEYRKQKQTSNLEKSQINLNKLLILNSKKGDVDMVKFLLEKGADIHADNNRPLTIASQFGNANVVKFLLENGVNANVNDNYHMLIAIQNNHIEVVRTLLDHGADINANNYYPIRLASLLGFIDIVRLLIKYGVNVKADNNHPIRLASQDGHADVVELLIENGANVNTHNNYPIRIASQNGYIEVVKVLVENGADVKAGLKTAIEYNQNEVINFLQKYTKK